jgi:hypothetical protein
MNIVDLEAPEAADKMPAETKSGPANGKVGRTAKVAPSPSESINVYSQQEKTPEDLARELGRSVEELQAHATKIQSRARGSMARARVAQKREIEELKRMGGAESPMRRRRSEKYARRQGEKSLLSKKELEAYNKIRIYSKRSDAGIDALFTIDTLYDLSKYEWYRIGGFAARLKAFRLESVSLDMDYEELEMIMELLNHSIEMEPYRLSDFLTFCYTKEYTEHKLCDAMVAWVEQAWMNDPETFMNIQRLKAFQTFMRTMVGFCKRESPETIFHHAPKDKPGHCWMPASHGKGEATKIPVFFRSMYAARKKFKDIFLDFTSHLPRCHTDTPLVENLDPFQPLEDIIPNQRVWMFPALLEWGLWGYEKACCMCLTDEKLLGGLALDDAHGDAVARLLADNGVDIAQLSKPQALECDYFCGKISFYGGESNNKLRCFLPSVSAFRNSGVEGMGAAALYEADYMQLDSFSEHLFDHLGAIAQNCISARYYPLVLPARREQAYITEIKRVRLQMQQQVIAAAVTAGITFGNIVAPKISEFLFG